MPRLQKEVWLLKSLLANIQQVVYVLNSTDGFLPSKEDSDLYRINVCYGSPGVIPMLCLGAEIFPTHKEVFLTAAVKAGEVCWQYGLLL